MEKLLNSYDKEYMKMAMLKHEETFREQVYELHRVYEIQKILMKNVANGKQVQELSRWNIVNSTNSNLVHDSHSIHKNHQLKGIVLESPADEHVARRECNGIVDESELELTLGPTSLCRKKKVDSLESAASFYSSSSTVSIHMKRSNSGFDQRMNPPKDDLKARKWSFEKPGSNSLFLSGKRIGSEVEEQLRQDKHSNPPWLFQATNLNTARKNHLQWV